MMLLVRLGLAPALVVGASLAMRRWGLRAGGTLGGLPVVGGPILLVLALQHGERFGARASQAALLGLISLAGFLVTYARLSRALPWFTTLPLGWGIFLTCSGLLDLVRVTLATKVVVLTGALVVATPLLPRTETDPKALSPPTWDLPLRALTAAALVLGITALAGRLGPHLSGLLTPFPIVASVLTAFTQAQRGHEATVAVARGILAGLPAFGLFCLLAAVLLCDLGTAATFAIASAASLAAQAAMLALARRRSELSPRQ